MQLNVARRVAQDCVLAVTIGAFLRVAGQNRKLFNMHRAQQALRDDQSERSSCQNIQTYSILNVFA